MTYEPFEIHNIAPLTRRGQWLVTFIVRENERIGEAEIAQTAKLTVRFPYQEDGSLQGLLDLAYSKAKDCLASASKTLQENSMDDLRAQYEQRFEDLNKPFELDLSAIPGLQK